MAPLWITFSRWLLAVIILIPLAFFVEKPQWHKVRKELLPLLIMGITGIIGYNYFLLIALQYTTATNAALVSAVNPGIIIIFSFFALHEKLTKIQVAGLIVSLLGVMVIITKGKFELLFEANNNRGDLMMLLVIVVWGIYSIIGKKVTTPPITATAVSSLFAIMILVPFLFLEGAHFAQISQLSIIGIIYMAVFPCVLSFIFWNIAVKVLGASKTGISLNLIPAFTAIIAVVLGEKITVEQIIGGLLVFIGIYLTSGLVYRQSYNTNKTMNS